MVTSVLLGCLGWSARPSAGVPHTSKSGLAVGWVTKVTEFSRLARACSHGMVEEHKGGSGITQATLFSVYEVLLTSY